MVVALALATRLSTAEELHQRFLEKLRDARYYDIALEYLADLEKTPAVAGSMQSEIPLERALLIQQSASLLAPKSPERVNKLDEAEKAFRDFLGKHQNHPRRSEASLALGNLLLTRGEEAKNGAATTAEQPIPAAIKYFTEAQELFAKMQSELVPIVESMKGLAIDPKDTTKAALRERYRTEYRQAQLLVAYAIENRGRSQGLGSTAWKQELANAAKAYSEFFAKEADRILLRYSALYFRSGIQRDLQQTPDAIDGYQRIIDNEGIDLLRPLQTKAMTEWIKLLATTTENKFPAAVDRAEKWEKQLRPDERTKLETLDFKLALAQARIDWANSLLSKDSSDRLAPRLRRDAREGIQALLRFSSHQERARSMLAGLGIEAKSPEVEELPKVKNFGEALTAAQERIVRLESSPIAILREQLKTAADEEKPAIQKELDQAEQSATGDRRQAIELLRIALRLFKRTDDRDQLRQTRFQLGYQLAQDKQSWEAIAIGEFLSRSNPGTEIGVDSASVALAGFGEMLKEQTKPATESVDLLSAFAEFLVKTWPSSKPAQSAASALVRIAMIQGDWQKAEQYLALVPPDSGGASALRMDLGLVLYRQYLEQRSKLAAGTSSTELNQVRDRAMNMLKLGLTGLSKADYDQRAIEAKSILLRLLINLGKTDEVATLLSQPDLMPLELVRSNPNLVTDTNSLLNVYRTSLHLLIGGLAASGEQSTILEQTQRIINEMTAAAGNDVDGKKRLAGIMVGLAKDLKESLDQEKIIAKKEKLANGLTLLLGQLVASSDSFTTQYWAAQTLSSVSESFDTTTVAGRQQRAVLLASAAEMYSKILQTESTKPGWIQPPGAIIQIRMEIGKGLAAQANFSAALDQFYEVLKSNGNMIDVQIEAARIYQAWAAAGTPQAFQLAIEGGRPASRGSGVNVIWGWGKISQTLAGKPKFTEQFFEARLQLAHCRHQLALSKSGTDKAQLLERAISDINSTALGYPDLGGKEMRAKFDALLKRIQQDAGKPPIGLQARPIASKSESTR